MKLSFTLLRTDIAKLMFLEGFSNDLIRSTDDRTLNLIERQSVRGLRRSEDREFLSDTAAVTQERPAGILFGLTAFGGGSPVSMTANLEGLWSAVRNGDPDAPAFIVSRRGAMYLATLRTDGVPGFPGIGPMGGTLFGVPTIISHAAGQ